MRDELRFQRQRIRRRRAAHLQERSISAFAQREARAAARLRALVRLADAAGLISRQRFEPGDDTLQLCVELACDSGLAKVAQALRDEVTHTHKHPKSSIVIISHSEPSQVLR